MAWMKFPQKVVYIAGKYSARTVFGRIWNIYKAGKVAVRYWELGYAVVCPCMNSALFGELWFHSKTCNYETWIQGDLTILKRCDAIVMMKNWHESAGAYREYTMAKVWGKEIIFDE